MRALRSLGVKEGLASKIRCRGAARGLALIRQCTIDPSFDDVGRAPNSRQGVWFLPA